MIRISAHPEAEKPEEQHHITPQAHVKFLLELLWLLFELFGPHTKAQRKLVALWGTPSSLQKKGAGMEVVGWE